MPYLRPLSARPALIYRIFNTLTLIGSLVILYTLSSDIIYTRNYTLNNSFLSLQLIISLIFVADFFVRAHFSRHTADFVAANLWLLLVSLPYLNILSWLGMVNISKPLYLTLKCLPLMRGLYGIYAGLRYAYRSRSSRLMLSYIYITLSLTFLAALIFFAAEEGVNPDVTDFGTALWWAGLNVTTMGANFYAHTLTGKVLTIVLPTLGMMLFPIFTIYLTGLVERYDSKEN